MPQPGSSLHIRVLHHHQAKVLLRRHQDLMLLAPDAHKGEVILRVEVANHGSCLADERSDHARRFRRNGSIHRGTDRDSVAVENEDADDTLVRVDTLQGFLNLRHDCGCGSSNVRRSAITMMVRDDQMRARTRMQAQAGATQRSAGPAPLGLPAASHANRARPRPARLLGSVSRTWKLAHAA
eukprot:CAMPEP_0115857158 /NCGR_PEP_ID=MMETSP0287-20121206/15428_1 /TAXON_ID=412157 /ORGANISM="Chrysochromulina rotalis, Strain UIO044" /LENGTH=181 /DNA_ID=CAMNT_0003311363 /DNA_START=423 /DNA_END=964 /DNA_ORIENTATION=-